LNAIYQTTLSSTVSIQHAWYAENDKLENNGLENSIITLSR